MERFFTFLPGVDYNRLCLNKEGRYSITRRAESIQIMEFVNSIVENCSEKTITDATACMGGDTINFSMHFKKVFSIEINPENFKFLHNNVQVFGCSNVQLFCGDSTEIITWNSDVMYIDPPWGGPSYRSHRIIELFVGKKRLDDWLEIVACSSNRPSYIFIKIPSNYNPISLSFITNFEQMQEVKIHNFFIICIKLKI